MKNKLLSLLLLNYVYNDAVISLLLLSLLASLLAYDITADYHPTYTWQLSSDPPHSGR